MADSITDNRTLVVNADSVTNWVASASATLDTDVKIQGTGSIAEQITNTRRYILYNMGSTQNWSNNVFYFWINCGVVGLLDIKANGGFAIRFAGPAVTDYIEFNVGGSDSWPITVEGGWAQFVVDIQATPSSTGGTPPATSAIQHIGYSAVTGGTMTKVADNTWIDEIRRLPDGSPGILVQGRNGGTTPWKWSDLPTQLGVGVGTAKRGPSGTVLINTPIQFFVDDATTHAFTDETNATVIWEEQEFAPADLYGITVLGAASGTANFTLGVKTGTGDAATGSLGTTFLAAASGVRWYWDSDAANIDSCNLWGCTLKHAGDIQVDSSVNSLISTTFIDCQSATVSNAEILRCSVITAATADGVAFMKTDDLSDIRYCSFEFSDGHAVELTTTLVTPQTSKGNQYAGYGSTGTNDAAVYNNAGGAVTINVTDGGGTPTYRNGTGASTTVNNGVTLYVLVQDESNAPIQNAQTAIFLASSPFTQLMNEDTDASGIATESYNYTAPVSVSVRVRKSESTDSPRYVPYSSIQTVGAAGLTLLVTLKVNPLPI